MFQLASVMAQSNDLPRNNCFTDVTRDSILSKLMHRNTLVQRTRVLRLTLKYSDSTITQYAKKSRLMQENNDYLKLALKKKDTIIDYNKKLTVIEKKKARKKAVAWGVGGVALGIIIKSLL